MQLEKTKRDSNTQIASYKLKYTDYKQKVKNANA